MRSLSVFLLAFSIVAAPVVWHLSRQLFMPLPPVPVFDTGDIEAEVSQLRAQVGDLRKRVDALDARMSLGLISSAATDTPQPRNPGASDSLKDSFAQVVLIADRRSANDGLSFASPSFLQQLIGLPRKGLTDDCQPATNPRLKELLLTEDVGPINARMLKPALISLRQVFANVQVFEPELYARIKSAGSLCVRRIRGSIGSASAHAYGLAVDINIDGVLDTLADGKTQLGLILLADFFKKEGWIWGAGFSREDSMHFEVSREKLEQWRRLGEI
ncbi:M15 family metallopeptidase [Roseibium sp. RKSG952]|uniref:M15 family metallopeptidase n=1 Tax=Roseibium sp. RKSG952 TaxID=2529384 RepID=UPI0012BC5801|nr:M15 family metallopeptidase [Roseibium sp. RKSG952]MTH98026.1 M15 family peptidase [Roseibium sp. RKSG952]